MIFTFLSVAGFANFQLISYHFKVGGIVPDAQIPPFYVAAMAVDMVVAPVVGRAYDRAGLRSLAAAPLLAAALPFLAFSGSYGLVMAGVVLWGAAMGVHETVMRAAIADLTPIGRRGTAYGVFNAVYGGHGLPAGRRWGFSTTPRSAT